MKKLITSIFILFSVTAYSQSINVKGSIKGPNGNLMQGVSIKVLNSSEGTMSDANGHYEINFLRSDATLIFSFTGYKSLRIPLRGRSELNVNMVVNEDKLDEVVVIGYQTQERRKVTSAVTTISGNSIRDIPEANFDNMLQGRLSGVVVQSSTGEPGSKPNIVIRGSTNLDFGDANKGNTQPLYVIDGVIYNVNNMSGSYAFSDPLSLIDPANIESISILKDASATAIYGARGGNGVIIIKTKRPQRDRGPQVTLSGYVGVTTRPALTDVTIGNAERNLKLTLLQNQLPYNDFYGGFIPQALTDSLNPAFNQSVDWQGMLIRSSSIVNNENLSVGNTFGEGHNSNYMVSLNHYSEQGSVKGYSIERYAPSIKLTLNPIRRLSIHGGIDFSIETRHHGAGASGNPYLFSSWNLPSSLIQLNQQEIKTYSGAGGIYDDDRILSYIGNIGATDTLSRGLTFTSNFSTNNFTENYNYFSPEFLNGVQNNAYSINSSNPSWSWENFLQYQKSIGKNNFTMVGGFSAYRSNSYYSYAEADGINVSGIYTIQTVPTGPNLNVNTTKQTKTTESYYGRLLYDFDSRYLFTATVRRDASSIYSSLNRWGTFPSFSAGWIVSDENFFQALKGVIDFFKVRASWGVTGQDPGGWYLKYQTLYNDASFLGGTTGTLAGNAAYSFLGGTPSTYNGTTVVTPFNYNNGFQNNGTKSSSTVRWERYPQWDIGGDINMFDGRLDLVVDWYQKDADNKFLWTVPADGTTGYMFYSGNYANIRNTGLEITANSRNMPSQSTFQWNTSFNISFNKNWVTRLPNGDRDLIYGPPWFRKIITLGAPLFSYDVWQVDGVYATQSEVPIDHITGRPITYFGTPMQAGDAKVVDQNGDFNIDYNDQLPTGSSPLPKFSGGITNTFSYSNFILTVFASYSYGNKLLNGALSDALNGSVAYTSWNSVAGPAQLYTILNEFWAKPGDKTTYPRLIYPNGTFNSTDAWNISRSYFLEPGGYIKIKQVTLGYNLPHDFLSKWSISSANIYLMAENLHTFKQSKDIPDPELYDPTTGSYNINYPTGLKFTLGARIIF